MNEPRDSFDTEGYTILPKVVEVSEIELIIQKLYLNSSVGAGTRNMLEIEWVQNLSLKIRNIPSIKDLLPKKSKAVQCTFFTKTIEKNWYVTPHRDLSIPLKEKFESDIWRGWSLKEGVVFVRPPQEVLESLVVVRIHLEETGENNGALEVVPGSHLSESVDGRRVVCRVNKGGALVMKPLLIHASSKLISGSRRVLHFLFGPEELPDGAEWANAV